MADGGDSWLKKMGMDWDRMKQGFGIGFGDRVFKACWWDGGERAPEESEKRARLQGRRGHRAGNRSGARGKGASTRAASPRRWAQWIGMNEPRNELFLHSGDLVVSTGLVPSVDMVPSCRNHFYI